MISRQNIKNAAQAGSYYERDNYYVDGKSPSSWWGRGAAQLGLVGEVDREDFVRALEGVLPDGTEMPTGQGGERRPGLDFTFSPPKSVSLQALLGGDKRIWDAHKKAVDTALEWLEKTSSQARETQNGKTKKVLTGNFVAAKFVHDTSRELDPQMHTHVVFLNVTKREDGQWRALDNSKLYDNRRTADAIYMAELADKMRSLGYEIDKTSTDRFELKGYTKEQLDHFSQRRKQIENALDERGFSSAKAAEVAALDTRKAKKDINREDLKAQWKARANELNLVLPEHSNTKPKSKGLEREHAAEKFARLAAEHHSERSVVFSHQDLLEFGLERGQGNTNLSDYEKALHELEQRGKLRPVGGGEYTTDKALMYERMTLAVAKRGKDVFPSVMDSEQIDRNLEGLQLNDGQRNAVKSILESTDRVVGVQGFAGTGKTTMLKTAYELARDSGWEVRGFANSSQASNLLGEKTGMETENVAMHLSRKIESIDKKKPVMWVIDEASMVSNIEAAQLMRRAEQENARVVLVGDKDQLPSVEAGKPFGLMVKRSAMRVSALDEIIRQNNPSIKMAVEQTIENKLEEAIKTLSGSIVEIESHEKRIESMAKAYLDSDRNDKPLVVTNTNADRKMVNDLIREGLKEKGQLTGKGVSGEVLMSKDFTNAEKKEARSYRKDDVVRFARDYKTYGVKKGDYAKVIAVDERLNQVKLVRSDSREVIWEPLRHSKVEVYSQEKREIMAGDHIKWTKVDRDLDRRNGGQARVLSVDPDEKSAVTQTRKGIQKLDLSSQKHWEYSYAHTAHDAQGASKSKVVAHFDSKQKRVVGKESWYVIISRAEDNLTVYTDDKSQLPEAVRRSIGQKSALEELDRQTSLDREHEAQSGREKSRERELETVVI